MRSVNLTHIGVHDKDMSIWRQRCFNGFLPPLMVDSNIFDGCAMMVGLWIGRTTNIAFACLLRERVAMDDSRSRERKDKYRGDGEAVREGRGGDGRGATVRERGFNFWMENLDEPRIKGREILTSP